MKGPVMAAKRSPPSPTRPTGGGAEGGAGGAEVFPLEADAAADEVGDDLAQAGLRQRRGGGQQGGEGGGEDARHHPVLPQGQGWRHATACAARPAAWPPGPAMQPAARLGGAARAG